MNANDLVFSGFHLHEKMTQFFRCGVPDISLGIIDDPLYNQLAFLLNEESKKQINRKQTKHQNVNNAITYKKHKHTIRKLIS